MVNMFKVRARGFVGLEIFGLRAVSWWELDEGEKE